MHPDYFAVLGQPRRPWLDPDELKREYHELTLARHPDRTEAADNGSDFAEITEAYRVLSNPRLRLQHLLNLEGATVNQTSEVPTEIADIFMDTAALISEIDRLLQRRDAATSAVAKSLLRTEVTALQRKADAILNDLNKLYTDALGTLRQLDERWPIDRAQIAPELGTLAERFGYLDRWVGQLREKQFQLST